MENKANVFQRYRRGIDDNRSVQVKPLAAASSSAIMRVFPSAQIVATTTLILCTGAILAEGKFIQFHFTSLF